MKMKKILQGLIMALSVVGIIFCASGQTDLLIDDRAVSKPMAEQGAKVFKIPAEDAGDMDTPLYETMPHVEGDGTITVLPKFSQEESSIIPAEEG
jgi:hypothetical protein